VAENNFHHRVYYVPGETRAFIVRESVPGARIPSLSWYASVDVEEFLDLNPGYTRF